jgi:hypothetical protein
MESIKLTSQELAYLVALVGAPGVPGVEHPHVPPQAPEADAVYGTGLEQLKADGWLRPSAESDSYALDEVLLTTIMTLAYPNHLVQTVRESRQAIQHYISDKHTVQLMALTDDRFQIDAIEQPIALGESVVAFVGNDAAASASASAAPADLPAQNGEFNVVRVRGAEAVGGRRATIHASRWLNHRVDRASAATRTLPLTPESVTALVGEFIRTLDGVER